MNSQRDREDLFAALLSLDSKEECSAFLTDLCTIKEIESMIQRFKAARMISQKKTYEQIIEATDISSATLSRVSKCYHYGIGYQQVIKKLEEKEKK